MVAEKKVCNKKEVIKMTDVITRSKLYDKDNIVSLFKYIEELNKLKQKPILNVSDYTWTKALSDIPNDPENISIYYRDHIVDTDEDVDAGDNILLSVHKPEFDKCPAPDTIFSKWLEPGWDSFQNDVQVKEKIVINKPLDKQEFDESKKLRIDYFVDDSVRVETYKVWVQCRAIWAERQKVLVKTRSLFEDLYRLYFELQRDSETMELIVANGFLCDRNNSNIKHPVLTKRVKLSYEPDQNIIHIEDVNVVSELYTVVFQTIEDINLVGIKNLQENLQKNDYHPLDRNNIPAFFKVLVNQLSSDSKFSEFGIPEKWMSESRFLLYMDPCYIMRKRIDSTLKAIEQIVENIQETGHIPDPIVDIASGGKIDIPKNIEEETLEEQLAALGGESVDIFLSKEANKEQLEIVKRIELYNAVLVQGPPGTGKTHTIANIIGHFLAQGKSILVTSQTSKALRVLKEKIAPGLQNLCVSVLEDSNFDMERSIDGITDYMTKTTTHELKKEMEQISLERNQVIRDLALVRRKIFHIINQECNCIIYNGEEISPSKAASFVFDHCEDLSYIPGKVRLGAPLPLSFAELTDLYKSNEIISTADEVELLANLPDPKELISSIDFAKICESLQQQLEKLQELSNKSKWKICLEPEQGLLKFSSSMQNFSIHIPEISNIEKLRSYLNSYGDIKPWMIYAATEGMRGEVYRSQWKLLVQKIQETCEFAEITLGECFCSEIKFKNLDNMKVLIEAFNKLKSIFEPMGRLSKIVSKFKLRSDKKLRFALEQVSVNGATVKTAEDCEKVLNVMKLLELRSQCAVYWDKLLASHGVPCFKSLDVDEPERVAKNWIPSIYKYLDWYQNEYAMIVTGLEAIGISADNVFVFSELDSDVCKTEKILSTMIAEISIICDLCASANKITKLETILLKNHYILSKGERINSEICKLLEKANKLRDVVLYDDAFSKLEHMYQKYAFQERRKAMLKCLEPIAPQWVDAIVNREGIHGEAVLPVSIEDAWRWKQLSLIIEELTKKPFSELQKESIRLSKEYRKITAKYAEKSAWYHLLQRTEGDIDMRHALEGWKQTVKKIGKGTGKMAPMLKAKARELMSQCQDAVPSWIMPINRALETLNPKINKFDVVIIDEASQSDVSSLAILYMGQKLVIVGDDKQVSPMAVGVEVDKINALQEIYIKDRISNAHLYDAKTSIYDIAKTTFQPLMLREHFRCAPEIIGFSNMLSYDYKIKPLRDISNSKLVPAVVNYRVSDGVRLHNKTNPNEARAIVALMKACMEQPEYNSKSFGVISLLGDEQVKEIQRLIENKIAHKDLISRNIMCGNASQFQGDERDVIFLSIVDSGNGTGPIRLQSFGPDDAYRKRYNVAVSRAKDQLWVVDSLDASNDLKSGDIRKILIDYSLNPKALEIKHSEIIEKADSPFEVAVATTLVDRGYHIVQQWKVGAYRLDMVAVCDNKTVAIECDGERYHSSETKVREDMERQTILERLGWRFIRIRGSEYFRNPEKTIERVINELSVFGIVPESNDIQDNGKSGNELLSRVKLRALQFLSEDQAYDGVTIGNNATAIESEIITSELEFQSEIPIVKAVEKISSVNEVYNKAVAESTNFSKEEVERVIKQKIGSRMSDSNYEFDLIKTLSTAGVRYVDKRSKGGALWIIGGKELSKIVAECKKHGIKFVFKEDGGRITKGQPGWWTK